MIVQRQQMLTHIFSVLDFVTGVATYLKNELAPQPSFVFDDISLRRPSKSVLASFLLSLQHPPEVTDLSQDPVYVTDGGHLVHGLVWPCPAT